MSFPPIPHDEPLRLATLQALDILDTAPEERFDRLTRMARRLFDVPIALVGLMDAHRQWFKSCLGLPMTEMPRGMSFCGHAILGDDVMLIPDTREDIRFHGNPLVAGSPHIRFYAGCPLSAPNGDRLGTLSVMDTRPRRLGSDDLSLLRDLARMAEQELAVNRAAIDELTALSNRRGFLALGQHALGLCRRLGRPVTLLLFGVDARAHDGEAGHANPEDALARFGANLRDAFRQSDIVARVGGMEFAALMANSDPRQCQHALARLREAIDRWNDGQGAAPLHYGVGTVAFDPTRHAGMSDMLADADAAMYAQMDPRRAAR